MSRGAKQSLVPGAPNGPIWIDLDNAPHVVFFAPLVREFERRGCEVLLTARAVNRTPDLAARYGLSPIVSGRPFPKQKLAKYAGTLFHALNLARRVRPRRPRVALSHGSRAQALAGALLRVPVVLFFDYEESDLRVFRYLARWHYFPQLLEPHLQHWKVPEERRRAYPGLKEHLGLLSRSEDLVALREAGIPVEEPFAVLRPESDTAHYLEGLDDSALLAAIRKCQAWGLVPVVVPRSPSQQERLIPILAPFGRIVVPNRPVNGMDLLAASRLLVSGGGTMNREAVVLGLPCISMFRGRVGALDRTFIEKGFMLHAPSAAAITAIETPPGARDPGEALRQANVLKTWIPDQIEADLGT